MTAPIDALFARLEGVKERGSGQWSALCPAHNDGTASLSVREMDDGMVLLHCFAGCEKEAILGCLGLEFSDLYPDDLPPDARGKRKPRRPRLNGWKVVDAIQRRLTLIAVCMDMVQRDMKLDPEDWEDVWGAVADINHIIGEARNVR